MNEATGIIGSRYRIETVLGEGGSGVVYRAIDVHTGSRVALKTLRSVSGEQITALKNEFRIVLDLSHRNVVRTGELFEEGGEWYISMELVQGVDFLAFVAGEGGRFDDGKLRGALRQLASALTALHGAGIVHRDIKPSNVMVTNEGRVVILDFGIAQSDKRARSEDGEMVGSHSYMAPEQVLGEPVGPAADFYALGVMLFASLTRAHPFEGTAGEVLERKCVSEARSPRELDPSLPDDLADLCERLLRLDAADRPTANEILGVLGAVPTSVPPPPSRWAPCLVATRSWLGSNPPPTRRSASARSP